MRLLLDTHTFLWFIDGDIRLTQKAKDAIENPDSETYVSIATFWEIAIKQSIGKLMLRDDFSYLPIHIETNNFKVLTVQFEHTQTVNRLPFFHRDPFDRILISQAISEKMTAVTRDPDFSRYEVQVLW